MPGTPGNGRKQTVIIGVALAGGLAMAGWAFAEVASLKERSARNESEIHSNHELLQHVSDEVKEIRQDVKELLRRR